MMIKLTQSIAGALLLGGISYGLQPTTAPKTAVVNVEKVLRNCSAGKMAKAEMNRKVAKLKAALTVRQKNLETKAGKYGKNEPPEAKKKELQDEFARINKDSEAIKTELRQAEDKLVEPILSKIRSTVGALAAKEGYVQVSEVGTGKPIYEAKDHEVNLETIPAKDRDIKITDKVIALMDLEPAKKNEK